jgi:hypothetical protein
MITSSCILNIALVYWYQFLMVFQLKFKVKGTDTLHFFALFMDYGSKFKIAPHWFTELAARWYSRT